MPNFSFSLNYVYPDGLITFEGKKYKLIRKIFKCRVKGSVKLGKEHLTYKWIEPKEAKKLKWFEGFELWWKKRFM
jgi:uncharacterized protein YggL (DUF469 family)